MSRDKVRENWNLDRIVFLGRVWDIDASTLQQDLKAGQSLADIATSAGSNEQAVIDLLMQQSTQRIDQAAFL